MQFIKIAVLGGCLSHQPGIPRSKLYTSIVRGKLREGRVADAQFEIAKHFEEDYLDRLELLLGQTKPDVVLVHVRSLIVHSSSLLEAVPSETQTTYYLHPALIYRWRSKKELSEQRPFYSKFPILVRRHTTLTLTSTLGDESVTPSGTLGYVALDYKQRFLRTFVRAIASLIGMSSWAVNNEVSQVEALIEKCKKLKVPLLVMGPSRWLNCFWCDHTCQKMNKQLKRLLGLRGIPYIEIQDSSDQEGNEIYLADRVHLNERGHLYVADKVLEGLCDALPIESVSVVAAPPQGQV